jgi:hypothetical protein
MRGRRDANEHRNWRIMPWWWAGLGVGVSIILGGLTWLIAWSIAKHNSTLQIEAIKIGLSVGAGTGGAGALLLAFRRQLHAEHVAQESSYDATQQRITELYSNAVEQLGHEKAPVRLGGLYALERLAQDNPEQRQTIVDVVCAYLRMPFDLEIMDSNVRLELQVRLAAQSLLTRHFRVDMVPDREGGWSQPDEPPRSYWKGIDVDFAGAHLIDIDFTLCIFPNLANFTHTRFSGSARFWRARFEQAGDFSGAHFVNDVGFSFASFDGGGFFEKAEFYQAAGFTHAHFGMHGEFQDTKFRGDANFNESVFNMGVLFEGAEFSGKAEFREVKFGGPNLFGAAQFEGESPDYSGATVHKRDLVQQWPPGWQLEPLANEESLAWPVARLVRLDSDEGSSPKAAQPTPGNRQ